MEAAMKRLVTRFGNLDEHLKELLHGTTTAASLKIIAAIATFGLHLMLGRMLGPDGSGVYFLAFTIITIASVLGRFGLDNALVRFIAAAETAGQPERVRGVYRLGVQLASIISCVLGGLLFVLAPWFSSAVFNNAALTTPLQVMALSVPPFALFVIHAQALQGLKRIRDAIATLSVITPVVTALVGLALIPLFGIFGAAIAYLFAAVMTLVFGVWRWRKWTHSYRDKASIFSVRELFSLTTPLFGVAVLNLVINWISILMLGVFLSSYEVGLFSAANRTAMLVSFVLIAVNSIAAPKFAALSHKGDTLTLKHVANSSTKLMVMLATPLLLLFIFAPQLVLKLFGSGFVEATPLLVILTIGQFINVATGSVGFILMMTGHERDYQFSLLIAAVVSVFLHYFFIRQFGVLGAAYATSLITALQNVVARWIVFRKFGF